MKRAALTIAFITATVIAAFAADPKRGELLRWGEQLAEDCVTCHRRDGKDEGIPGIVYMSEQEIVSALVLYKTGRRDNKAMVSVAASLDDQQMRAVAAYLSSLGETLAPPPPPPPAAKPPSAKAASPAAPPTATAPTPPKPKLAR